MGWKKFTKSAKKTVDSGKKAVEDTGKKAVDDAKKVADDAKKAAENAAAAAKAATEKAATDTVNSATKEMNKIIGSSLDWFEGSANGFSQAGEKLAADARKELTRVGNLAQALLDQAFLAALEALVDQVFDDFEDFIDETLEVLEDIGKKAAAATDLAADLAGIKSTKNLNDALKLTFVSFTRLYPDIIAHTVLSDVAGFKSVSYGVFGSITGANQGLGADGGLAADSAQLAEAYTFKREAKDVTMALFAGYSRSITTNAGSDVGGGIEAASWRDKPSGLAGKCIGASITVESGVGGAVQFSFSEDLSRFLGINVAISASPSGGVAFDVFHVETFTYLF